MDFVDSLPIFAGKPGRYFRNDCVETEGLILDWNECVKNVTVSSREHDARFDIPDGLWQSCGTQGQVSINLFIRFIVRVWVHIFGYSIGLDLRCVQRLLLKV